MKKHPSSCILALFLISVVLVPIVHSSSGEEDEGEAGIIITPTVWKGEMTLNDSLLVESELTLENCSLIFGGLEIEIGVTGSIYLKNSTVSAGSSESGFFVESLGDLIVENSTLDGCLDNGNGFFGIYIENGSFSMTGSSLERSGMIRTDIDRTFIEDSKLPGIIATSGNLSIIGSRIGGMGASIMGSGKMEIRETILTTNLSFSNSIAAISCEGGILSVQNVTLNGTFGGGIYSEDSTDTLHGIVIDLPYSEYGIRSIEGSSMRMDGALITGPESGIEIINHNGMAMIDRLSIQGAGNGLTFSGSGEVITSELNISNCKYGILSTGHMRISSSRISDVETGIILEGSGSLEEPDVLISEFSGWGLQTETWQRPDTLGLDFEPGPVSISNVSMYGRVRIDVTGPSGEIIDGAYLDLSSKLGNSNGLDSGYLNLVWGYLNSHGDIEHIRYELEGKWGNAVARTDFIPAEDQRIILTLPMTDIIILDLERKGNDAYVTVTANGSRANEVRLTIYIDGSYSFSRKLSLEPGEEVIVDMPIGEMDKGEHILKVSASSNDEYSGLNGILLTNNEMSIVIEVEEREDNDLLQIAAIVLVLVASGLLIVTLLLRRKD